jgi:hypothetical protein
LTYLRSFAILFAVPILARSYVLLGFGIDDPLYRFGGISSGIPGAFPGGSAIDPNYGFVDQALTTRAMLLFFSGHFPWWNSLEGLGAPLAGEMQSSAFFPLSPLVLLPDGNLVLNLVVGILAGFGMLLMLRHLGVRALPALVGAILYEMCGTFSWLSGAWSYSIPWLPYLVLGIEHCRSIDMRSIRRGSLIVAASIALLLASGFIESSYFEGLAGVTWTIARVPRRSWRHAFRYLTGVSLGAIVGLALGAPVVVAFADELAMGFIGMHATSAPGGVALPPGGILQKLLPYVYGPIEASHRPDVGAIWGNTGGYVGIGAAILAISGVFAKQDRGLRFALVAIAALGFAAIFGGPLQHVLLLVPGVKYTAYFRYIDPAISFAVATLAAFGIDELLASRRGKQHIALGLITTIGIVAYAYHAASTDIGGSPAVMDSDYAGWFVSSFCALIIVGCASCAALFVRAPRWSATILSIAVCVEAVAYLAVPTLSDPAGVTIDSGGITYLQQHVGLQRSYTLGPLSPNYGSYYGIASLSYNDLPSPKRTVDYIKTHLDPLTDGVNFIPIPHQGVDPTENFQRRLTAFEHVGVRYVLTAPGASTPWTLSKPKYQDRSMAIYELPNPTPYFRAPKCRVIPESRESATTTCAAPSILCRLELNAPGWAADSDGHVSRPDDCDEIFQAVRVPAGRSHVRFRFEPPYEPAALTACAAGSVVFGALLISLLQLRRLRPDLRSRVARA